MNLTYDVNDFPLSTVAYLCRMDFSKICVLNGVDVSSCRLKINLASLHELSFDVNRYVTVNGENAESDGYDYISTDMYVLLEGYGYFKIVKPPSRSGDGTTERLSVTMKSANVDFTNKLVKDIKVNTGDVDSYENLVNGNVGDDGLPLEYITFCNDDNENLSLVHILLSKIKGWTVDYIDPYLKDKKAYLDIEGSTSLYSIMMNEVATLHQCLFTFDIQNFTVSAYALGNFTNSDNVVEQVDHVGSDTNIYLSYRNLAKQITVDCDDDSIYTVFDVKGGDGLDDVTMVNFGEYKIENLSYYLNTKYMSQTLIDKYNTWKTARETYRPSYIEASRNYNHYDALAVDLQNRSPVAELSDKCWLNENIDNLNKYKTLFDGMIYSVEHNEDYFTDGEFDIEKLKVVPVYYTYLCYQHIVENLELAIENYDIEDEDDMQDYNDEWEYDWELHGIKSLEGEKKKIIENLGALGEFSEVDYYKLETALADATKALNNAKQAKKEYQSEKNYLSWLLTNGRGGQWEINRVSTLEGLLISVDKTIYYTLQPAVDEAQSAVDNSLLNTSWANLSDDQKKLFSSENDFTVKKASYTELNTLLSDCKSAIVTRQAEYDTAIATRDTYKTERETIANTVSKTNSTYQFSDSDFAILDRLYKEKDYENQNYIMTSLDSTETLVDRQKELYDDATEQLVKYSQPQIYFTSELSNFLNMPEFKDWHSSLNVGNFVHLEVNDNLCQKQRIVSISFNPYDFSEDNLQLEFSNMIKGMQGVNDFVSLLGDNIGGTSSISRELSATSDGDFQISTEILEYIANSSALQKKFDNLYSGGKETSKTNVKVVNADVQTLNADTANINNVLFGSASGHDIGTAMLAANYALISDGTIDSAIIVRESVGTSSILKLNTKYINVLSDNGNLVINDNTIQIKEDGGRVRVQIGKDANEDYNMCLWDSSGNLMFDASGLTANGITRKIIRDDMVADDAGISGSKIDIVSLIQSINNSTTKLNASSILYEEGKSLQTKFSETDTTLNAVSNSVGVYTMIVETSGVANEDDSTEKATLTAHVYEQKKNSQIDITDNYDSDDFYWTRYSEDTTADTAFNNSEVTGNPIELDKDDIKSGAVFTVSLIALKDKVLSDDEGVVLLWGGKALMINQ